MATPLAVLIVEDSQNDAQLLIRQLKKADYAVTFEVVETEAHMRSMLARQTWDVVISDFSLPQFDCSAALALLKETGLDIPFIVVSGVMGEETAVTMMKAGAHDYVMKGNLTRLAPAIERELSDAKMRQECRRAESAVRENELRHRTILQTAMEGFWVVDMQGRILETNEAYCRMSGYTGQELLAMRISDLSIENTASTLARIQKIALLGEERFESRHRHKNGSMYIVEVSAQFRPTDGGIIIVFLHDITERKRSEQLLAQERERLSVTLRSIGDGVITTDIAGTIVLLNKAAEGMTGWKSAEAAGRPLPEVFNIINELTRKPCENPVATVLGKRTIVELTANTCLIAKDGREMLVADSAAPIYDIESRVIGTVLVFRDLTEEKKLVDAMQREQKLESVGILAGGIAHDFNNMLSGIFGYLDLAKESVSLNRVDLTLKYLDKAFNVFDRAKGLTQQLLTFSKGGAPVRKTIQIAPLIQHSAIFALSGSNTTCRFDIADDLWLCDCDETQVGQAIDNIVINARQAMPMGGKIIITAANVEETTGHPGCFVRISIQDEGTGIHEDIIAKIFDPFFSTKATGHGLGLATVFSIIKRHDGWIDVESKPGAGTIFHVFIPASQKMETAILRCVGANHRGTGTILVMDDEESILEVVGSMLHEMGYAVVPAKNGKEALTLFTDAERLGKPFAASILDLTIPGGTGGKETAAAMRKICPQCVIIVSSGYSEDPVISNPIGHGFTDRIIKPYRRNELKELMMRVMPISTASQ